MEQPYPDGADPYGGAAVSAKERPTGVTVLAVLYFVLAGAFFSIPFILGAFLTFLEPSAIFGAMACLAPLLILGLLPLLVGVGLLMGQGWARILGLIVAVISLLAIPIGTILGIIIIIYLRKPEVKAYFE